MMLCSVFVLAWCFCLLSCSKMSAGVVSTLSWCHLYLPWLRAVLHLDKMCIMDPLAPHNLYRGSSFIPHLCELTRVRRVSEGNAKWLQLPHFSQHDCPLRKFPPCPDTLRYEPNIFSSSLLLLKTPDLILDQGSLFPRSGL